MSGLFFLYFFDGGGYDSYLFIIRVQCRLNVELEELAGICREKREYSIRGATSIE